jgi:hypothetical protein
LLIFAAPQIFYGCNQKVGNEDLRQRPGVTMYFAPWGYVVAVCLPLCCCASCFAWFAWVCFLCSSKLANSSSQYRTPIKPLKHILHKLVISIMGKSTNSKSKEEEKPVSSSSKHDQKVGDGAMNSKSKEVNKKSANVKKKAQPEIAIVPMRFLVVRVVMFCLSLTSAVLTMYLVLDPTSTYATSFLDFFGFSTKDSDGHNLYAKLDREKKIKQRQRVLDIDLDLPMNGNHNSKHNKVSNPSSSIKNGKIHPFSEEIEDENIDEIEDQTQYQQQQVVEVTTAGTIAQDVFTDENAMVSQEDLEMASTMAQAASLQIDSLAAGMADSFLEAVSSILSATSYFPINRPCSNARSLQYTPWQPDPNIPFYFPLYATDFIDQYNEDIEYVIVIQHGNSRNGNEYFCSAIQSIQSVVANMQSACAEQDDELSLICLESETLFKKFLIIAPQFLIPGDTCSHIQHGEQSKVDLTKPDGTCGGYMIWSSNGWKDGSAFLNQQQPSSTSSAFSSNVLYSYDIYNLLVRHFTSSSIFPNVRKMTFFGFSAGGQALLRHALLPNYQKYLNDQGRKRHKVSIRTVISDIGSYPYLDNRRPHPSRNDKNVNSFDVPDATWLSRDWNVDQSNGKPWVQDWDKDHCSNYNNWRYGLDNLQGYYLKHDEYLRSKENGGVQNKIVRG